MISEKIMKRLSVEECQKVSIYQFDPVLLQSKSMEINGQLVELTQTKCNYGGDRVWFLCPTSKHRVGALYRKPLANEFLCRHCNNLTYQLRKYHRSPYESFIKTLKGGVIL